VVEGSIVCSEDTQSTVKFGERQSHYELYIGETVKVSDTRVTEKMCDALCCWAGDEKAGARISPELGKVEDGVSATLATLTGAFRLHQSQLLHLSRFSCLLENQQNFMHVAKTTN
jgi:hypothetical protein